MVPIATIFYASNLFTSLRPFLDFVFGSLLLPIIAVRSSCSRNNRSNSPDTVFVTATSSSLQAIAHTRRLESERNYTYVTTIAQQSCRPRRRSKRDARGSRRAEEKKNES